MRNDYRWGDGAGYGYGHSYGPGRFPGYGTGHETWGRVLATVGGHEVRHLYPWPYIAVGWCEAHSIPYWRKHWEEIAESEGIEVDVEITTEAVQDILAQLNEEEEK